jgi:hypothetical protein
MAYPGILKNVLIFWAGVDGLVTLGEGFDTTGAFFGGGINWLKKDFKPEFFILFNHLRQAGFINGEPFFYLSKART